MSQPDILLIGAGGHAHACIDVLECDGAFRIAGLIGLPEERSQQHLGYTVIGCDHDLPALARQYRYALVTLGQIASPAGRIRLYRQLLDLGFALPAVIAPTAHVSRSASIGAGSIVMHGAIVNAGARVGDNCIINSRAIVEHDASLAEHCHLSTGAILNGHASVAAGSFIGSGSIVREGVRIGQGSVVGMALAVRHDLPENCRYIGRQDD